MACSAMSKSKSKCYHVQEKKANKTQATEMFHAAFYGEGGIINRTAYVYVLFCV